MSSSLLLYNQQQKITNLNQEQSHFEIKRINNSPTGMQLFVELPEGEKLIVTLRLKQNSLIKKEEIYMGINQIRSGEDSWVTFRTKMEVLEVAQYIKTHKCLYFFIFNFIKQGLSARKEMGTIQSKIKNGYSINKKPLLGSKTKEGVKPCKNSTFTKNGCATFDLDKTNSSQHDQSENSAIDKVSEKKPQTQSSKVALRRSKYPYSSIGLVTCILGDQKVIGTGFLIGPNFVLTCAHNLCSFNDKKMGKNISFLPMFSNTQEGPAFQARKVYVSEQLLASNCSSDELLLLDYAVIELQCENIQQDFGTLNLNFNFKTSAHEPLTIIGYNRHERDVTLSELSGDVDEHDKLMKYEMSAGYGMSGAPIVEIVDGDIEVVGIHLFCRQKNGRTERGGIKLNEDMLRNIEKWCAREEEELDLREKGLGKEGLKYLSKYKWSNLVTLNLSRNSLQSNTAKYLKRGHWKNLTSFDLGGNLIGKEGAQALAQSEMKAIMTLNLWGNCVGKAGAYCLGNVGWENLTNLNLYNNEIGDDGVEYLTHANWKRLNSLNLGKNGITFTGAQFLLEGKWVNLASLNLWGNDLSGEEMLLKARLLEHFRLLKFLYF